MNCPKCGAQNDDQAATCSACGAPIQPATEAAPSQPAAAPAAAAALPEKVPNYLVQAILVTLFCCLPFGIVAIVFAAQVNGKAQAGDIAGATEVSRKAKMWCWWAFGVGLAVQIIYGIFYAIAIAASASANM